jgi:hypothetical protein
MGEPLEGDTYEQKNDPAVASQPAASKRSKLVLCPESQGCAATYSLASPPAGLTSPRNGVNIKVAPNFQDSSGTLRFITNLPCEATPQIALEIRRGAPAN